MKIETIVDQFMTFVEGEIDEKALLKEVLPVSYSFASNSDDLGVKTISLKTVTEKEGKDGSYIRVTFSGIDLVTSPRYIMRNFPESVIKKLLEGKQVKIESWEEQRYARYSDYELTDGTYFSDVKNNPEDFVNKRKETFKAVFTPVFAVRSK